jgi:uncharacterized membrane protein YbaN (DUF454 family)
LYETDGNKRLLLFFKITKNYFMDGLLLVLDFICMLVGILGSLLPVLPGPAISWLGTVIILHKAVPMNYWL